MMALLVKTGIRGSTMLMALLGGMIVPLLIWAAGAVGLWQLLAEWRYIRIGLLAGNLACNLHTDCPPGYECVGGRCVPATGT